MPSPEWEKVVVHLPRPTRVCCGS